MVGGNDFSALAGHLKREQVKIILEGTHSTGKSTLLKSLARILGLPTIAEPVREVFNEWEADASYRDFDPQEIAQVQRQIMDLAHQRHEPVGAAVADRSPVSVYAYTVAHLGRSDHPLVRDTLDHCRHVVQRQLGRIDCIYVVVPPNIPNDLDGCREDKPYFREQIDLLVRGMLDGRRNVVHLQSNERAARVNEALHLIERRAWELSRHAR
jgi:nicotinamide riboside kinase